MKKLTDIKQNWIKRFDKPLIISGPCSAESEEQVLKTAQRLEKSYIQVFRAGIWKPRTKPNKFEGIGRDGLQWLQKVKIQTGLMTATEVAKASHVKDALEHDVDIFWIGARSTVNPFTVQEIADALKDTDKIVLVKNPIHPDLDLWIGALERLAGRGIEKLGVIHRGFSTYKKSKFRNQPNWQIVLDFKNYYPNIPILCDPSHICGNREGIFEIAQQAFNFEYNGLMVEVHCDPDQAWSDAKQQIIPEQLLGILKMIKLRQHDNPENSEYQSQLERMRAQIDELDQNLISLLAERMRVSEKVGELKKMHNVAIFQPNRWESILQRSKRSGKSLGLSEECTDQIFKTIHQESVNIQNKIMIPTSEKI
ncbi:MAG: chorismate mutase [Flavobacteriales bacterium AspAUS03]